MEGKGQADSPHYILGGIGFGRWGLHRERTLEEGRFAGPGVEGPFCFCTDLDVPVRQPNKSWILSGALTHVSMGWEDIFRVFKIYKLSHLGGCCCFRRENKETRTSLKKAIVWQAGLHAVCICVTHTYIQRGFRRIFIGQSKNLLNEYLYIIGLLYILKRSYNNLSNNFFKLQHKSWHK